MTPDLQYDNSLFFNINNTSKINVLAINNADDSFLKRIYTTDEFNYTATSINAIGLQYYKPAKPDYFKRT